MSSARSWVQRATSASAASLTVDTRLQPPSASWVRLLDRPEASAAKPRSVSSTQPARSRDVSGGRGGGGTAAAAADRLRVPPGERSRTGGGEPTAPGAAPAGACGQGSGCVGSWGPAQWRIGRGRSFCRTVSHSSRLSGYTPTHWLQLHNSPTAGAAPARSSPPAWQGPHPSASRSCAAPAASNEITRRQAGEDASAQAGRSGATLGASHMCASWCPSAWLATTQRTHVWEPAAERCLC